MRTAFVCSLCLLIPIAGATLSAVPAAAKPPLEQPRTRAALEDEALSAGAGKGKRAKVEARTGERARASSDVTERAGKKRGPRSLGAPNHGRLDGGVRLKPTSHLKLREGSRPWALPVLTKLLHRAADRVASRHKGSVLLTGDLSAKSGGPLDGHNSHQSGRDVDVGFFVTNSKGKPAQLHRFLAFDGEGVSREIPWARFDDARNWMLVAELLKDEGARVRYIFVSSPLRARLLKYAAAKKAPKELLARAAAAMMSPDNADVHDDHFHVRIACPESMRPECVEESGPRDVATGDHTSDSALAAPPQEAPNDDDPY